MNCSNYQLCQTGPPRRNRSHGKRQKRIMPAEGGRRPLSMTTAYQPNILVDTSHLSREEWLEYRRLGIGGSDVAAILGISPFRTARDLYYDKLNIVTADDEGNWVAIV